MAQPLVWPGKYFFYPIGNTSALCLTRDIALEESASILLLGCGDPRSILYTVFSEPDSANRNLDFTCCDREPAVLARNVLLFSMIIDNHLDSTILWNIFFHFYLDERSLSALEEQCKKLSAISQNVKDWAASPYGQLMKMCTEYTLSELRRHWVLYAEMHILPPQRLKRIQSAFTGVINSIQKGMVSTTARSAGPLLPSAGEVVALQFENYWKKGTTSTDSSQTASLLNPTFCYSLAGEGCNVHYGTDPMQPFHFAPLFGNTKRTVSVSDFVRTAQAEFKQWCTAFHSTISSTTIPSSASPVAVRFFLGDAIAVCRFISQFAETGTAGSGIPVDQWKTQTITLNKAEGGYGHGPSSAPTTFDVIDTSNLCLLNVIISTIPLLHLSSPPSGVLYTETLLFRGLDATKEFADRLYGDITVMGLLVGLCPVDYVSGFNARSNIHELFLNESYNRSVSSKSGFVNRQFQQLTTWRRPSFGDAVYGRFTTSLVPYMDPWQLGTFFYDMYHKLFEQEDSTTFFRMNQDNIVKAIASSNLVYYMRETFVLFLKLVRRQLHIPDSQWRQIMDRFYEISEADNSMPMNTNNQHDFWGHLHRNGLYTVSYYRNPPQKVGLFSTWGSVPTLVRVVLSVPRDKLSAVFSSPDVGTPQLICDVGGRWSHNVFSALHVAFGKVISTGTPSQPRVLFEEDPEGRQGKFPLVISFVMPTVVLTELEPQENLSVSLGLPSSTGSIEFVAKLGPMLRIFSAKLLDETHVHVLPEQARPFKMPPTPSSSHQTSLARTLGMMTQIGECDDVIIGLDEDCELVASLSSKISVKGDDLKRIFADKSTPISATQISPCTMRIAVGNYSQDVVYPFPVIGSQFRLRLARTSMYIEVIVPPFGPTKPDGMKLNLFPTATSVNGFLTPWNIHRVNLSRSPTINTKMSGLNKWLNPLAGSQMSNRERSLRKHQEHDRDTLMAIKDTLHSIIVRSAGIQGPACRFFALRDEATNNSDTLFFISELRYDLSCHSIVCDGYVLPLTKQLLGKIAQPFENLVREGNIVNITTHAGEMAAWKQLIPAFVERCRTSWTHGPNCEYVSTGKIPLTEDMEKVSICSCGKGKDVDGMYKVNLWKHFAPYVTRIALSPLFAVSYLETVGRDPEKRRCFVCRAKGKPKIKTCTGCKKVRYCSEACQKKHKKVCKP
ncbi:hypothetical protein D9758_016042 [Tetrapyrgos nigripes]|uniref:MYND-type domain-containing protein n=1 Tax=Tetrapyrgos nigripes TaxID=182062 RepID=A0A8H5FIF4_9AGAR|nr:hypothetical protein D9758_016042 [Tetrapyrgos nigripes]